MHSHINVFLPSSLPMSFHRVLPRPIPFSNEDLANRWAIGQGSAKSARIMTNERSNTAHAKNSQVSTSSTPELALRKSSSPASEKQGSSLGNYGEQKLESRHRGSASNQVGKPAPSSIETWEGDIPSQICLCQPDPKVPRPRNGKQAHDSNTNIEVTIK